jgi:hypothetical protein
MAVGSMATGRSHDGAACLAEVELPPLEAGGAARHPPPAGAHPSADGKKARHRCSIVGTLRGWESPDHASGRVRRALAGAPDRAALIEAHTSTLYPSSYIGPSVRFQRERALDAETFARPLGALLLCWSRPLELPQCPAQLAADQGRDFVARFVALELPRAYVQEVCERLLRDLVGRRSSGALSARPFLGLGEVLRIEPQSDRLELVRVHWFVVVGRGTHADRKYSDVMSCRQEKGIDTT